MKRQVSMITAMLTMLVALSAASVHAQSDLRLKANIPFAFSVGNKVLPAGEYTISHMSGEALKIQKLDGSESQCFFTIYTSRNKRSTQSSLVFNRYGDQYFLSTIWSAGEDTGLQLKKPHVERELIRMRSAVTRSSNGTQTVSILLQL